MNADNMAAQWEGFTSLPALRQVGLLLGLAASVALGVAVVLWTQEPNYGVLYGGLEGKESAEIAQVLQQQGIDYKIDSQTGALMVPASRVHEVRLTLANQGLPRSSGLGLEGLQQPQEFGTSQFVETSRYQHMLETELARSIATINAVESARVHLALPKQSVFVRKRQQPSASVMVSLYAGRSLEPQQVAAITHMVASSIANLEAERVTIVDQRGNLLSDNSSSTEMALNQDQFEYTRRVEETYVSRIESLLAPIVGLEGVRAEVNAELDFTVTEQTQEVFNPDTPALRSEQLSEENTVGGGVQGIPGALSNQPPGAATVPEEAVAAEGAEPAPTPGSSRRSTTANYELDRTISHSRLASGSISRLSIAVVVDDRVTTNAEGEVVREPRTPEELARITTLVREAVGYNAQRGDTVNVINAAFTAPAPLEAMPETPLWKQPWVMEYGIKGLGLLAAALLFLMVLRPVMRSLATVREQPALPAAAGGARSSGDGLAEDQLSIGAGGEGTISLPKPGAYEDNIELVRGVVKDDPKLVAQVVRTWVASER